jgi:hypothetical protein
VKKVLARPKVKDIVIHPFAFAVFPVLSLYVKNMGRGFLGEAIGITIGVFISAALFWLFVNLFVKDRRKSSVIVSVFFVLFFSYGHIISAFGTLLERMHLLDEAWFLVKGDPALLLWLVVWTVLFVVASFLTVRLTSDLRSVTNFLNVVGLTLVVMIGLNFFAAGGFNTFLMPRIRIYIDEVVERIGSIKIGASETSTSVDKSRVFLPIIINERSDESITRASEFFVDSWQEDISSENTNATSDSLPDIYYVILDMYARADYLEEIYHYDNFEFLSFLTDRGFYVANKSRANYPYTAHSLPSSLNFMYLDEVAEEVGDLRRSFRPSVAMLKNSRLVRYLRSHGYTTVAFATGYEFTEIRDADLFMEPAMLRWHPTEFQSALIHVTPLIVVPILRTTEDDLHRRRVLYIFDHIADATRMDSPTFVFAHVNSPHSPYVFGPNGEPVQSKPGYTYDEFVEAYRNQVTHVNKRMRIVIEKILSQSSRPSIIIVQADHGACFGPYPLNIPARMSILNAYYFPDQDYEALCEDITPVNTFRIVLNKYLGTDYELLEDRSYYSSPDHPYLFTDVTEEVLAGQSVDRH